MMRSFNRFQLCSWPGARMMRVVVVVASVAFASTSTARALPQEGAPQSNVAKTDGAKSDVAKADVAKADVVKSGGVTSTQRPVYEVARELVCDCPDCGKQALDQCPNCETGREYREVIAGQLKQGRTKAQIVEYFANTYGEHMLGTPRQQGFGRAAFALPALAVLLGLLPLGLVLRRRKHDARRAPLETAAGDSTPNTSTEAAPAPAVDDPRLAAALRDYDF